MKPKLPMPIKKFEKYAVEFGEAIYSGRVLRRLGCELFSAHSTEYRTSNNPKFANQPYSVCLDCGIAERDARPGDDNLFEETITRMSREELQEMEKYGSEINVTETIAKAGVKRNFLSKYNPKLVKEHSIPLRKRIMGKVSMEPDILAFGSGFFLAVSGESLLANSMLLPQMIENYCGELGSGARVGLGIPLLLLGIGLCFYPIYKNYISKEN